MRSPPTSTGLVAVELLIEFIISAAYLTIGVVHHMRYKDWICLLYFLLAGTAAILGCIALAHMRRLLSQRQSPPDPEFEDFNK